MGKKGKTSRLKRKPAPRFWPIHRKEEVWVIKPSSGPHSLESCLPLTLVLRDILGFAETKKEVQAIITQGKVLINGKTQSNADFPVGLMDVISIPEANKYYRILPSHKGLFLCPTSKDETNFKLCRIEDKKTVTGGVQINLHDGSNLLVKVANPKDPKEVIYETFDVLKITIPDKAVAERITIKEGNVAVITGGKNIGVQGKIVEIEKAEAKKRKGLLAVIEDAKGTRYQTILDFIFSIGKTQPLITTAEAANVV